MPARRFAPPWSVEEQSACFVVRTTTGSLVDDYLATTSTAQRVR